MQLIVFFAVSLITLFFTRPVALRYFNKDRIKTNAESLVGQKAVVTEQIDNLGHQVMYLLTVRSGWQGLRMTVSLIKERR